MLAGPSADAVGVVGWVDGELGERDRSVDRDALGGGDGEGAVAVQGEDQLVEVHPPVMEPAQATEVVQLGAAALGAFDDVVGVELAGVVAAGELTGRVTALQEVALPFRRCFLAVAFDRPVRGVDHGGDRTVTGEAFGEFFGDRVAVVQDRVPVLGHVCDHLDRDLAPAEDELDERIGL